MNQKTGDLRARFKREDETAGKKVLGVLQFFRRYRLSRQSGGFRSAILRWPSFMFSGEVPMYATKRPGSIPAVIVMLANVV